MREARDLKLCDRTQCAFYTEKVFGNRCSALRAVYDDSSKCAFFKTIYEVDHKKIANEIEAYRFLHRGK